MNLQVGLLAALTSRPKLLVAGVIVATLAAASQFAAIGVSPPSLKFKHLTHATGSTQLFVGPDASLDSTAPAQRYDYQDIPLAQTLADLMASPELRGMIGRASGIPARKIAIDAPLWTDVERIDEWPSREKRDSQIIVENAPDRIEVDLQDGAPVITLQTQAPTTAQAQALAMGATKALNRFASKLENSDRTGLPNPYHVSQLTPVVVAAAGESTNINVAAFTFASVMFIWCGAMLFLSGIADDLRVARIGTKVRDRRDRSSFRGRPSAVRHPDRDRHPGHERLTDL